MTLLKADHDRGVELAGVPGRVPRPVDIDQTHTGFKTLRTLRIYRFDLPAVIDGHAEEDEVYIVVLTGSVELQMRSEHWSSNATRFTLAAASSQGRVACAAYLPPQAEYGLTPLTASDIAYARARPSDSRAPAIFTATPRQRGDGVCDLLDESSYAERLRIRLLHVDASRNVTALTPIRSTDGVGEGLIHVRTTPVHNAATIKTAAGSVSMIESWDTFAVGPGEYPTLRVAAGSSAMGLVVSAL